MSTATTTMKRGVSLYSYQQAFYLRELTLEQCIAQAAAIGAPGIETLAEQMMPGFPDLPDSFYDEWHGWMEKYDTYPVAHDMMLELKRWKDRLLTDDEQLDNMLRDIRHASKLGCPIIRVQVFTPTALLERSIPFAAEHEVKLAVEIHTPYHLHEPSFIEKYEMFQRYGPEWVGFIPDMGAYVKRFPRVIAERWIRDGGTEHLIRHMVETYDSAYATATDLVDLSFIPDEIAKMGGTERDLGFARTLARFYHYTDPRHLLEVMPYIHHVHAKFYEMTDDGVEYSIPYEDVIRVLAEGGYSGHLSSEYEGQRAIQDAHEVDEVDQVRRQHEMFTRILEEIG